MGRLWRSVVDVVIESAILFGLVIAIGTIVVILQRLYRGGS